jgi:hypothetical protein
MRSASETMIPSGPQLGLDQRLIDRLGRLPDPVINLAAFDASRTSSSADWSRVIVCCPSARNHCRGSR